MKAKVVEIVVIPDGNHSGIITEINYRKIPYEYVDLTIMVDETEKELKCGVPFFVALNSQLGEMLIRFGAELKKGTTVEIEDFIKTGAKVDFITMMKKGKGDNKDKEYCNIIPQSVKPKA